MGRAEPAAVAVAITHDHIHIATDSLISLQIEKKEKLRKQHSVK